MRGWRRVELPTRTDERGSLTFVENATEIPFDVRRVRWIHGAPSSAKRGGHGHHRTAQLFVAVAGALTVSVDDGRSRERVRLASPSEGLLIGPLVWIDTEEWSDGAVLLMLGSEKHDPDDYIRDYRALVEAAARGRGSGRSATT